MCNKGSKLGNTCSVHGHPPKVVSFMNTEAVSTTHFVIISTLEGSQYICLSISTAIQELLSFFNLIINNQRALLSLPCDNQKILYVVQRL